MNNYIKKLKNNKLDGELSLVKYCDKAVYMMESKSEIKRIKACILIIKAMISEIYEVTARKKYMSKVFKCNIKNIAGDIDELIELKENTYLYATDFTYSAIINDEWLKNIRVIWGNAYLYSLDDINKLQTIKYITGDIFYKNNVYTFEELKQEFINSKRKLKK